MRKLFILIALLLIGCVTTRQHTDPQTVYRKDVQIKANGYVGKGVLVVSQADKYDFEFKMAGKADLFTMTTCHRQVVKEEAGEDGFFSDKKKVVMDYIPVKGIEDKGSCVIDIGGFSVSGKNTFGTLDIQTDEHQLPATIRCNGSVYQSSGVSICQSKEGLIQEIEFAAPVHFSPSEECPVSEVEDSKKFRYEMSLGKCLYLFMDKETKKLHKLTTVGYESVLLRGEK